MADRDEVHNRFKYHPGTDQTIPLHEELRDHVIRFVDEVLILVPAGRHQSLALTALQEAAMWAHAGIACDSSEQAYCCGDKTPHTHDGETGART